MLSGVRPVRLSHRVRGIRRVEEAAQACAAVLDHALSGRASFACDAVIDREQRLEMLFDRNDAPLRSRAGRARLGRPVLGQRAAGLPPRHRPHPRPDRSRHSPGAAKVADAPESGTIRGVPEQSASARTRPKVSAADPWSRASALAMIARQAPLVVDLAGDMNMPRASSPSARRPRAGSRRRRDTSRSAASPGPW